MATFLAAAAVSPAAPPTVGFDFYRIFPKNQPSKRDIDKDDWDSIDIQLETNHEWSWNVLPINPHHKDAQAVSHFTMNGNLSGDLHTREILKNFALYKVSRGTVLPEGLGFKKDDKIVETNGFSTSFGCHVSVFPTRKMTLQEFTQKLFSAYVLVPYQGGEEGKPSNATSLSAPRLHNAEPSYPQDETLCLVSKALFEMSLNPQVKPDRALRSLMFHYRLAESGFSYEQLLTADALSAYAADALERCVSDRYGVEMKRDKIRSDLNPIVVREARLRADDDSDDDESNPSGKIVMLLDGTLWLRKHFYVDSNGDKVEAPVGNPYKDQFDPAMDIRMGEVYNLLKNVYRYGQVDEFISRMRSLSDDDWNPNQLYSEIPTYPFQRNREIDCLLDYLHEWLWRSCEVIVGSGSVLMLKVEYVRRWPRSMLFERMMMNNGLSARLFLAVIRYFCPECAANAFVAAPFFSGRWQKQFPEEISSGVFVSCFSVFRPFVHPAEERDRMKFICCAINKYIELLKQEAWGIQLHSIVTYIAPDHNKINLADLLPGEEDTHQRQRLALANILQEHEFTLEGDDICSSCSTSTWAIVLVCMDRNLHHEAKNFIKVCLEKFRSFAISSWDGNVLLD